MSSYERIVKEVATDLQLGHRSRWVAEVIASWISSHPLGLDGLEQQFEQVGLFERFRSWQDPRRQTLPIIASELELALGSHAIGTMARRSGMGAGEFRVVACDLFPALIAVIPLPIERIRLDRRTARHFLRLHRSRVAGGLPSASMHGMALRAAIGLLCVLSVVSVSSWLHLRMHTPLWVAQEIVPDRDPRLSLVQRGDQIAVHGSLPTEAARRRIWSSLVSLYGGRNVHCHIVLDPGVREARWLPALIKLLPKLRKNGLVLGFEGTRLRIDSSALSESERFSVSQVLRQNFSSLSIMDGLWGPGLSALSALPKDAPLSDRIAAMNLTTLRFRPGTSELTQDSGQTVAAVADALRSVSRDTRVQVGAHTDSSVGPAESLGLSQQRAEQVVLALQRQGVPRTLLVAKGHGQDQLVADNRSEVGRAQNQRIAYQLMDGSL